MPQPLRAACIGLRHSHAAGLIGTFERLNGVRIVAFCEDTDSAALERIRRAKPAARHYRSVDDLLGQEEFDIAYVALPANESPTVSVRLAQAGKHFLLERTFARTAAEMSPVVEAVRKHRVKVLAHHPWRRHPAIAELKRLLDAGTFGKPLALHATLVTTQVRPGLRDPRGLAHGKETEGGGILHMLGGHWIEAMCFLMGCDVKAVSAVCRPVVGNMPGEDMDDVSVVGLEFDSGAVGSLLMGYLQAVGGAYESGLALWGSEGSASWPAMGAPTLQVTSTTWKEPKIRTLTLEVPKKEGVKGTERWAFELVQDWIDAIREDREPAVTVLDGCRVAAVIDAAYESSRTGRRVEVLYEP